ncbi:MAG: hypothetical protein HKN26_02415 [Acidimicrobiales bacterium]|nr:hypothetical protein [Acidimicrobiales bacterium]
MQQLVRRRTAIVAMVVALVASSCVIGPITGPGPGGVPPGFDLSLIDYERSEVFLGEAARSYGSADPLSADGKWTVIPDAQYQLFLTRLVVNRPVDPADFNGTVIVEWMNVTAGADLPNDWTMAHNEYTRNGYVWVGVSAQAVGVNAAKVQNPARYGNLNHPGDSYSYDIFTEAGRAIASDPLVLGGLTPERLIATGESQSASRLVTYINARHLDEGVFDGYLVHSRGSGGSSLRQAPLGSIVPPRPGFIRDDLDVPVMVVQAEDDVIRSNSARQPDTALFRLWEMTGTAHADSYTLNGPRDVGDGATDIAMFNYMRNPQSLGCDKPINAGPHYLILQAAFAGLDNWLRTGVAPPNAPRIALNPSDPSQLQRDALGIALGGIRSPHVDVPVATLDGLNDGLGFCRLFGSTTPLTDTQLDALYADHDDFVAQWTASVNAAVAAGFFNQSDAANVIAAAALSDIGN